MRCVILLLGAFLNHTTIFTFYSIDHIVQLNCVIKITIDIRKNLLYYNNAKERRFPG